MNCYAIEVVRKPNSQVTRSEIVDRLQDGLEQIVLANLPVSLSEGHQLQLSNLESICPGILDSVECVTVYLEKAGHSLAENLSSSSVRQNGVGPKSKEDYSIFIYELDTEGGEAEYMEENDEMDGQSAASHHWLLPSRHFHGMWDSLVFESDIKRTLIDYVKTALMFSSKGVNPSLISWNKVILLHGPPGTGKTSLCKALAQKSVIRLQDDFLYGQLIEINSHSLFSKWFSESGKLVTKMFDKILELVEDPKALIFLLIDEVESLAQCRQSSEMGNEPTDSIRAVNALLTQIDRLKSYPNVVILTTSNIVGSIDLAFVDRADLKLYIGHPPASVIYGILASCINELLRVGVVVSQDGTSLPTTLTESNAQLPFVSTLHHISEKARGLSGRFLRKLPFLTFAKYFSGAQQSLCSLSEFLKATSTAVDKEFMDRLALSKPSKSPGNDHSNKPNELESTVN